MVAIQAYLGEMAMLALKIKKGAHGAPSQVFSYSNLFRFVILIAKHNREHIDARIVRIGFDFADDRLVARGRFPIEQRTQHDLRIRGVQGKIGRQSVGDDIQPLRSVRIVALGGIGLNLEKRERIIGIAIATAPVHELVIRARCIVFRIIEQQVLELQRIEATAYARVPEPGEKTVMVMGVALCE